MTRNMLIDYIKSLCQKKNLELVDDIQVGDDILVIVKGEDCATILDEYLHTMGLAHTTPTMIADGIGSYVTLD